MALARWSAGQAKTTTATAAAVQGTVGPAYTDLLWDTLKKNYFKR